MRRIRRVPLEALEIIGTPEVPGCGRIVYAWADIDAEDVGTPEEWAAAEAHHLEREEAKLAAGMFTPPGLTHYQRHRAYYIAYQEAKRRAAGMAKRRGPKRSDEVCKNGHPRTPENTYTRFKVVKGKEYENRECRVCLRESKAKRREVA